MPRLQVRSTIIPMLLVPAVAYLIISVILWQFVHAVFVPELIVNRFAELLPETWILEGSEIFGSLGRQMALWNAALAYFAGYFAFSLYWKRLQPYFGSAFLGALALWLMHVLLLYPLLGEGIFGYRMPRGPYQASMFIFASHWVYARSLQVMGSNDRARPADLDTVKES